MTERIQQIIGTIRTKMVQMHAQLVASREKYALLETDFLSLKSQLDALQQSNNELKEKLSDVELQLITAKEQVVSTPFSVSRKEEEIDELVKEIEYCISQLKK
jgi:chromosome segregation ATPase